MSTPAAGLWTVQCPTCRQHFHSAGPLGFGLGLTSGVLICGRCQRACRVDRPAGKSALVGGTLSAQPVTAMYRRYVRGVPTGRPVTLSLEERGMALKLIGLAEVRVGQAEALEWASLRATRAELEVPLPLSSGAKALLSELLGAFLHLTVQGTPGRDGSGPRASLTQTDLRTGAELLTRLRGERPSPPWDQARATEQHRPALQA